LFVVVVFVAIVVALAITLVSMRFVTRRWRETEHALADKQLELLRQEEQSFSEFAATLDIIFLNRFYNDEPFDPVMVDVLRRAEEFYTSFVAHHSHGESSDWLTAKAHSKLGRIHFALGELDKSEEWFRRAGELYSQLHQESPNEEVALALAITDSRLSCVLASIGDLHEARRFAAEAVEAFPRGSIDQSSESLLPFELPVAYRNLALLKESLGESGIDDLRRSISISVERVSSAVGKQQIEAGNAILADSYQMLMWLLWSARRWNEAEATCLHCIRTLEELVVKFGRPSDGEFFPAFKYQRALSIAQQNLRALKQEQADLAADLRPMNASETPSSRFAAAWQWRPLYFIRGQDIHHSALLQGKLHGEFERQDGLLLVWPDADWGQEPVLQMIKAAYQHIPILLFAQDPLFEREAEEALQRNGVDSERIGIHFVRTNSLWIRDYGPQAIVDAHGRYRYLDADYWSDSRFLDDCVPLAVSKILGDLTAHTPVDLELEWGALACNGTGLCLVSTSVLQANRKRGLRDAHVTDVIKRLTGSQQVIFLDPLKGEKTGHVDMFVTFTAPNTVVLGDYRSGDPANAELLDRHAAQLAGQNTSAGELNVVRIPMPPRGESYFGGTYANVVFANGVLLVPTWPEANPELETEVFDTYRRLLPGWKIVGIDCGELGRHGGALHCATMNLYRIPPWYKTPDS
jgi:agmatine/peptidylarginine deiminase